jgi:hypothetical protein
MLLRIASGGKFKIYNLSSGLQTSHAQWLEAICTATGSTWSALSGAPLQQFSPIRVKRLQTEFGFAPKTVMPIAAASTNLKHKGHYDKCNRLTNS